MANEDKQKALEAALGQIEKQFGKGTVMKLGEQAEILNVEQMPVAEFCRSVFQRKSYGIHYK